MRPTPTTQAIIEATSQYFEIPATLICDSTIRTREVTYARHMAMFLSRKLTFRSYQALGRSFGFVHSGVIYGYRRIEKLKDWDKKAKNEIGGIKQKLSQ